MRKEEKDRQLEECKKLKSAFAKAMADKEEYLAGWKRARADFLNYKKNEEERLEKSKDFVKEDLLLKILPILDNIYVAEKKMPNDLKNNEWVRGLLQTKNQILDFLKTEGVEEISSIGERFNPNFHEVVEEIKSDKNPGIVVEEIQKGYIFNNKVIRPARVKVVR